MVPFRTEYSLAIKSEETGKGMWKAGFFAQKQRDKMKQSLIHNRSEENEQSANIIVGLAAIFWF